MSISDKIRKFCPIFYFIANELLFDNPQSGFETIKGCCHPAPGTFKTEVRYQYYDRKPNFVKTYGPPFYSTSCD